MSMLALADTGKYIILKDVSTCFYMSMLALADTGKYNTEGSLNVFSTCLCWLWLIQVNTLLKEVSMCFYMSMLALTDTDKYITEGCLNVFLHVYVGSG